MLKWRSHDFSDFSDVRPAMKPINAWPLIILLAIVLFLLAWFNGYLA